MKKNKKALLGIAALAAVTVIGGSWAYWSQDLSAVNEFETGKFDTDITEEFTPPVPGEWVPGVEVEKRVKITNSGDVKLAAIASIDQVWRRVEDVIDPASPGQLDPIAPAKDGYFSLMFRDDEGNDQYASDVKWGENVVVLVDSEIGVEDAVAENLGLTAVTALDEAKDKWVLVAARNNDTTNNREYDKDKSIRPVGYSDLQFIYNGIIDKKSETPELVTAVELNQNVTTSITGKTTVVNVDKNGEKVTTITTEKSKYGYDSARYTMTVNATTIQATRSAITSVLKGKMVSYNDKVRKISEAQTDAFLTLHNDDLIPDDDLIPEEINAQP
ncbi:BsaA family SipW-dependent biofilm matrix protein [Clostridium transplantifaecale]|uniref:BsaA family SipW-dependent biofilm matrix protein n=1 Tax=Clostridium transplantifaecale TaxID=2479838 RepID=UPI000F63EAEF|nr:BsaA family SipW-dependent biofilm matrix protein [Clostridium transplantifaecale]